VNHRIEAQRISFFFLEITSQFTTNT